MSQVDWAGSGNKFQKQKKKGPLELKREKDRDNVSEGKAQVYSQEVEHANILWL